MLVVPSLSLARLMPSNQAAHRGSRCPLTRISYRSESRSGLVELSIAGISFRCRLWLGLSWFCGLAATSGR
jgi:hypothetical protein